MKKITCDHCDTDVIVSGRQTELFYEYDALPFPLARANPDGRAVLCAPCDGRLRERYGLPLRMLRDRF